MGKFTIELYLGDYPECSACDALDFERYWGLEETGKVRRFYSNTTFPKEIEVDENFARLWFKDKGCWSDGVNIPLDMLIKGQIIRDSCGDLRIGNITIEQAKDLFIAARFRELKNK